jgi:hypothetical protein
VVGEARNHGIESALKSAGFNDDASVLTFLRHPEAISKLKDIVRQQHPDWEAKCDAVKPLIEQTGCSNWYDWRVRNWGTKWPANGGTANVHVFKDGAEAMVTFDTAWAPPRPVIAALGKRFPDLTFTLVYYESNGGFHGRFSVVDGQTVENLRSEYYGHRGG